MFLFYGILARGPWCFAMLWTPVPVSSIKRQWMPSWLWGPGILVLDMAGKTQFWWSKEVCCSESLQEWCLLILGLSLGNNFLHVPNHLSMAGLLTCSRAGWACDNAHWWQDRWAVISDPESPTVTPEDKISGIWLTKATPYDNKKKSMK